MKKVFTAILCIVAVLSVTGCGNRQQADVILPMDVYYSYTDSYWLPHIEVFGTTWLLDTGFSYPFISFSEYPGFHDVNELELVYREAATKEYQWHIPQIGEIPLDTTIPLFAWNKKDSFLNLSPFHSCKNVVLDYDNELFMLNARTVPDASKGAPLRMLYDGDYGFLLETEVEWDNEKVWAIIDTGAALNLQKCDTISAWAVHQMMRTSWEPLVPIVPRESQHATLKIGSTFEETITYLPSDAEGIIWMNDHTRKLMYYHNVIGQPVFIFHKLTFDFERNLFFIE